MTANFEEAITHTVTISAGETGALGSFYDNTVITQNEGTIVTLPIKNSYFYKEGYTAIGWTDGTNDYAFGAEVTLDKDYVIYPKFEPNVAALGDEATIVTWDLSSSAAGKMHIEYTTGYVVTTAQVGTAIIDVPSYWDNTSGKLDNRSRNDSYAQVNGGSKLTIPAIKGMTVTLTANYAIEATLAGEQMTATSSSPYTATYTYEGDDNAVEIVISDGKYFSTIVAEYPYTGIPGPANPTEISDITWDFTNLSAKSFDSGSSYSFKATDGKTEMRYSAGSSDAIVAKNGDTNGYLKENGKTSSGTVYDIDGTTDIGKNRLIRLYVSGKGKLTINCNSTAGVYKVLDGSASGDVLLSSLSANTQSDEIVANSPLWIETTTKGYITSIVWTPTEEGLLLTTTASMQGWRSFYDAENSYTVDAKTKVYVATEVKTEESETKVALTKVDAVYKGVAVLLKTTNQTTDGYSMTLTKTTETITSTYTGESLLKVTPYEGNWYRLGSKDGEVGFFPFNATGAAAGIVVLNIDSSNAQGARGLTLSFADDETTGISNVNDNVNLNKVVFDLQGRRVAKPTKGMYIVNGKKVVIK